MKPENLEAALKVIPNQPTLVNVVSRRVRQLASGQRPLIDVPPRTELLDIALLEIAAGKVRPLSPEETPNPGDVEEPAAAGS